MGHVDLGIIGGHQAAPSGRAVEIPEAGSAPLELRRQRKSGEPVEGDTGVKPCTGECDGLPDDYRHSYGRDCPQCLGDGVVAWDEWDWFENGPEREYDASEDWD